MPGTDSTQPPVSLRLAHERATSEEARLRSMTTHEQAVLIDGATGAVIWRKSGQGSSIHFDDNEIAQMRGHVLTHNHPRGWRCPADDPRRAGSSFSSTDIAMPVAGQLAEMRAVSPGYLYRIQPPAPADSGLQAQYFRTHIASMSYSEVRFQTLLNADVVRERLRNRVSSQEDPLTQPESESILWHEVVAMVVASWGVNHERKEWIP